MAYYYAGSRLVAKQEAGQARKYFLSDRLSVRLVLDGSGNVSRRQGHLPFGEEIAAAGEQDKHHFTSYERDAETGLDYAVNRYDSESTARFTAVDPKATSARKEVPQSWNRYIYTANDPINRKDPWGLDSFLGYPGKVGGACDGFPFFGTVVLIDGFDFYSNNQCISGPLSAPVATLTPGTGEGATRAPCSEQDFNFSEWSGNYTASELRELAQMAVGEAGLFFDQNEIEAVIATVVNRQNYNIAYVSAGARRGPFNGGTTIIGILEADYDAYDARSGETKLRQAKELTGRVLYEGDYVCDQLKAAKNFARLAGTLLPDQMIALYPVTYNHANRSAVPGNAFNVAHYGQSWFWMQPLPRP